jgi:hypothetical protein
MKTAELTGALLDYWVAKALGHEARIAATCEIIDWNKPGTVVNGCRFEPHRDWAHVGPIIERERIELTFRHNDDDYWRADIWKKDSSAYGYIFSGSELGPTPLIAAMRAYVASKFGETVPDEVLP